DRSGGDIRGEGGDAEVLGLHLARREAVHDVAIEGGRAGLNGAADAGGRGARDEPGLRLGQLGVGHEADEGGGLAAGGELDGALLEDVDGADVAAVPPRGGE